MCRVALRCLVLCCVALCCVMCGAGLWPPSWWGVLRCSVDALMRGCAALGCGVLCCVALRVVPACGPPHGGACCVVVRCDVLAGVLCCGGAWPPVWWGVLRWGAVCCVVLPCVLWWCVALLMVGCAALGCGVLCCVALCVVVLCDPPHGWACVVGLCWPVVFPLWCCSLTGTGGPAS